MNYNDISAEWKTLRRSMGGFFCHVDNMMTRIENGEKKLTKLEHYGEEMYLNGFNDGYDSLKKWKTIVCSTKPEKSDIDKIYSALSPESQRVILAMAQKFLDLETNDGGEKDA